METQKKMPKCGFAVRVTYEGQKDFDTDYIEREIKEVVRKVGPGDEDYVIENKVIEHKTPIKEVIDSQAGEAGMEAYLKPYLQTGQDLPSVKVSDEVQDFSQFPETLEDAAKLGEKAKVMFANLPEQLKDGAKTPEEFLSNLTQTKFLNYLNSIMPKKAVNTEVKENENK